MNISRNVKLVWDFIVPVLLVAMIAAITVITLRVDSKFAAQAIASRRAACVAVYDGNKATYDYLNQLYATQPHGEVFLTGLLDAYQGNLTACLIKANTTPKG